MTRPRLAATLHRAVRPRLIVALAVIGASTLATLVLGSLELAAVTFVLGAGAVLLAGLEAPPAPVAEEPPAPPRPADVVLDAVAEPLLQVVDGRVARANPAALAMLGGHVLGGDLRLAIRHPAAAELLRAPPQAPLDLPLEEFGEPGQRWELRARAAQDGSRIVQLVDRTAAHAADRMRVDFVANASHELRTPLAAVLGFVETLQDDETGDDRAVRQRFLEIIAKEGRRMLRLVEDLLSLSRIEGERHQPPSARLDLGALAETIAAAVIAQHGVRGADLQVERTGNGMITGDHAELTQLIQNLMGNALKYGAPGTPVHVAVTGEEESVLLVVSDRGEGIAAPHLPRLTERFYRVDAGRSRAVGGTGLGLAIVKHIVEHHRGTLSIQSEVGVGTTVTVRLPRVIWGGVTKLSR